jgi:tetratricopeptide (TPR) repeat protein
MGVETSTGFFAMRTRTALAFALLACGLFLVFPLLARAAQKNNSNSQGNAARQPILVTIVVRDMAGGSTGITPTVQLYGEAQDGTQYTGVPRNKGDQWIFVVPGPGTYTAEVNAPGYKTAQRIISISSETDNPQYDVILEPDNHPRKTKGSSILAPKARAELDLGKHALSVKQFDEAKVHLEKALQLAPTSPEVNYYIGLLYYYIGNLNAAVDRFQKSISMDHGNGQALLALGEIYYTQKDYAHATNVLEQGLTLEPDSWRAEAVLGSSYYKQADYEKGREHAQKALMIGKDEASGTSFLLGKCLAALGRKPEAIAAFQAFLEQQPASDMTRTAQAMLKQLQSAP